MSCRCRRVQFHRPCWVARPRPVRAWRRRHGAGGDLMHRGSGGGRLRDFGPRIERMADFVDRFENEIFGGMESFFPTLSRDGMRVAMDVREEDDKYIITADLPGMTKSDVKIQVLYLFQYFKSDGLSSV